MEFIKGEQEEGISTEAAEILGRNDKTRQREKNKEAATQRKWKQTLIAP